MVRQPRLDFLLVVVVADKSVFLQFNHVVCVCALANTRLLALKEYFNINIYSKCLFVCVCIFAERRRPIQVLYARYVYT